MCSTGSWGFCWQRSRCSSSSTEFVTFRSRAWQDSLVTVWGRSLALFAIVATAAPVRAEEAPSAKERARALFKSGEAHYQAHQWDAAIADYQAAFALLPMPLLLFDIAQAYR